VAKFRHTYWSLPRPPGRHFVGDHACTVPLDDRGQRFELGHLEDPPRRIVRLQSNTARAPFASARRAERERGRDTCQHVGNREVLAIDRGPGMNGGYVLQTLHV
jgi:hypothetical protein